MATTYDVAAFQPTTSGPYIQALATPSNSGQLLTGEYKLAQRYIRQLLTPRGSIPYLPNDGTNFVNGLRFGAVSTESDVLSLFVAAQLSLRPNLNNEETTSQPANEKYLTSSITKVTITGTGLAITIVVVSQAQTQIALNIPLAFAFNGAIG
jgi:hypothetical protein